MKSSVILERLKSVIIRQDGNVAVLAAFMLVVLLGMTAVVVDGGKVYAVKMHLQKTANAAVLSGAQELTATEQNVRSVADRILHDHGETASLINLSVTMKDRTTAVLKKVVDVPLAKVLGFDKVPVSVKATAKIEAMGAATGAAPIGIDQSIQLHYGQTYRLKVDENEATNGNFGIIALGAPGASTYETNLANGYQGLLTAGDVVDTQTGNIAGKTRDAVQARINRSPYTPGDMSHLDDPRILLVPVYTPHNYTGGQIKQIEITGFAYFYLTEPMDYNTKEVIGVFIQRTGIGTVKPGAVDRGAYVIKLTE
ncbi:Putative Flp pilus-assembly TadE/G-like [Paenibacillus sp. yr247]|uniref:Tad domain-containing protein n=1 Tax=Paenibacillus sp. yr247 TaxID=1761880 RepID=UPI00087E01B2|nr:Tad domain-containing protein [Paenibacillus sp. yr247]SDP05555.1 Putative Flp pilus-assembly TadE/G-like [Paenibacillus sp. yr247]